MQMTWFRRILYKWLTIAKSSDVLKKKIDKEKKNERRLGSIGFKYKKRGFTLFLLSAELIEQTNQPVK